MNTGKKFENQFNNSCKKQGIFCLKLKDKSSYIKTSPDSQMNNNICDFIIHHNRTMFCIELKTTQSTSISFNQPPDAKTDKSFNIRPNQVAGLMEAHSFGIHAGFVLNYREHVTTKTIRGNCCYYISIENFIKFYNDNLNKGSINSEDCKKYGIEIGYKKLRVNYEYYINEIFEKVIGRVKLE